MKLVIYGSGGLGIEVYEIALRRNATSALWEKIVFVDDIRKEGEFFNTSVLNFETLSKNKNQYECIIAVGEPSARELLYKKLLSENIKLAKLIDPTALISPASIIADGVIICEFSTIHANVKLGINTLIQPFCTIGHDIAIGNHTVFSSYCAPGGNSVFGDRVYVGMHSAMKEGLTVGDDVIIGMGSVVFRDVPEGSTVLGNPARVTRGNDQHRVFTSNVRESGE